MVSAGIDEKYETLSIYLTPPFRAYYNIFVNIQVGGLKPILSTYCFKSCFKRRHKSKSNTKGDKRTLYINDLTIKHTHIDRHQAKGKKLRSESMPCGRV